MSVDNQTKQVDIAKELADKWYMEQRYTENGRWQECKDYADKAVSQLLAQAEVRGRLKEAERFVLGVDAGVVQARIAELEASLKDMEKQG